MASVINRGIENEYLLEHYKELMNSYNIHSSEWAWVGSKIDFEINNDSSIEYLKNQVEEVLHAISGQYKEST